ncbi:MAG: VOC family protein [Myxococcota bacterium]
MSTRPANVIPTLRYRDATKAIAWLCDAFGFERHAVYADGDVVHHAQLLVRSGDTRGMIMCSSARDDAFGKLQAPPIPGAPATQSAYIVVEDADLHHARAVAHGAVVVYPLTSEDYGGRGYSCRDPEGHLWNFGTYDPWAAASV